MGFNNEHRPRKAMSSHIAISLHRRGPNKIRVIMTVRAPLLERFGWRHGDCFAVVPGDAKDVGKIKIYKITDGYAGLASGHSLHIQFPAWKGLPFTPQKIAPCKYRLGKKHLIVTLPEWS